MMELEDAVDIVVAWRETLLEDVRTGRRKYGGKQSVQETADALDVVIARVTRGWN